jgi:hypothetical protein
MKSFFLFLFFFDEFRKCCNESTFLTKVKKRSLFYFFQNSLKKSHVKLNKFLSFFIPYFFGLETKSFSRLYHILRKYINDKMYSSLDNITQALKIRKNLKAHEKNVTRSKLIFLLYVDPTTTINLT